MKKDYTLTKAKIALFYSSAFLLIWFLLDFLFACILLKASLFVKVETFVYILFAIGGLIIAAIITFILGYQFKKEHSLVWLINDHFQGLLTTYFFLLVFVNCFRNETVLEPDRAKDLLSIQWAIFAITIGAFAVWHLLVYSKVYSADYKETPRFDNQDSLQIKGLDEVVELSKKHNSHRDYLRKIDPLIFIIINLISIVLATGAFYVFEEYSLFVESLIFFSFYWCTNTLINVILDISIDLLSRRKDLLKETRVKASEFNDAIDSMRAYYLVEELSKSNSFSLMDNMDSKNDETLAVLKRLAFIVEEYKKDANSFERNKKEFIDLAKKIKTLKKRPKRLSSRKPKVIKNKK